MVKISTKIFLLAGCFVWFLPSMVFAQEATGVQISPYIIDEKAGARDMFNYQIKVKNNLGNKIDLYLLVNDISFIEGKQKTLDPALLDKSNSLTRWISISRGLIELLPGEEKEIPLSINVNMSAAAGKYYAAITFSSGSSRYEAEARALTENFPQLIINFEIEDGIIEKSQLSNFRSLKNVYFNFPALFSFNINNIGNSPIEPTGFVYVYNRRGVEVATLDVNLEKKAINPNENGNFQLSWQGNNFGKFKARIEVEYGTKEKRDLQDTVYFYVLPWRYLLIVLIGIIILAFALSLAITRSRQNRIMPQPTEEPRPKQAPRQASPAKPTELSQETKPVLPKILPKTRGVIDLRIK